MASKSKRKSSHNRRSIKVRKSNSYAINNKFMQTRSITVEKSSCCTADCDMRKRTVFLDLLFFYQHWRSIPSNIISDSILILPNIYTEWISKPSKYIKLNQIPKNLSHVLSNHVFIRLLQWKQTQGLLFCMLNRINTVLSWNLNDSQITQSKVAPFWHHLNNSLCKLTDPSRNNQHYKSIYFDSGYYKNMKSKYGVTSKQIFSELETLKTMSCDIISEILFQCNPSLNIITTYRDKSILKDKDTQKDANVSCVLAETEETEYIDVDSLLNNIFAMYTVSVNDEMIAASDTSVEMEIDAKTDDDDDGDNEWWFAEDYENYDGFQEIPH